MKRIAVGCALAALLASACQDHSQVPYDSVYITVTPGSVAPICTVLPFSLGAVDDEKLQLGDGAVAVVSLRQEEIALGCEGASCQPGTYPIESLERGGVAGFPIRATDGTTFQVQVTTTCPGK